MIGWRDVYKVVEAMVPLYVALGLGYGSVRWWRIFTPEQCEAINRLVACFTLPFFAFEFTLHTDPFSMNYRFIAADAVSKLLLIVAAAAWAKCGSVGAGNQKKGDVSGGSAWAITSFSLSSLTNSLVVGVPLASAMYGRWAQDLIVQLSVVQAIVWLTLLLFALELRKQACQGVHDVQQGTPMKKDPEAGAEEGAAADDDDTDVARPSFRTLMKTVWLKLAMNPNTYASIVGMTWAFVANRWHIEMPNIMEGSVLIMSKAGTGMAMFSMGLFMALQKKMIACGPSLTAFGMVLKFVVGPAAAAIGGIALGLRGDILHVAIIQGALPQSITSFIFAREYGVHADVLSTAVIFGMLVSLPILVGYYVALELIS